MQLCAACWFEDEIPVENVNGRCDRCGGTDWLDYEVDND